METTNLSRIEQAVAFVNEVSSINKRFEVKSVSVSAKCEFNEKGEISLSAYIWVENIILRSIHIYHLEREDDYAEFLTLKKGWETLLDRSAEEIEIYCYEQKVAELKAKLNECGK